MNAVAVAAQSGFVTNDRGAEIQRRLDRLNLSDRDFERRTGVERKTLRRAIDIKENDVDVRRQFVDAMPQGGRVVLNV